MIRGCSVGLRAVEEFDLPQLMSWRNNPAFRKYFREINELNYYNQHKWFQELSSKKSEQKMFSIVNLKTDELIGACGLCHIDWVNRSADFSIYIGIDDIYIDNYYALDAAKVMTRVAFDVFNLHRLWAEIYSIDEAKKFFFESLDFKLDAVHRQTYWYCGEWHDSLFYSLLSTDSAIQACVAS